VAPAKEPDPLKRTVLVLKWFLAALKRQQYAGRDPSEGVKKPLNAFLGEVFTAKWEDEDGATRIVSEQVSHHPPITACYLWNERHGVHAEGFACQSITFSGSVNIKQMGYATIHLDKFNEDYLIPLPNVKVCGLITGSPYPEITGTYSIVSSSGYIADIDFSGKKLLGLTGTKNSFSASVYDTRDGGKSKALYTAEGTWSEGFTIRDEQTGVEVENYTYDTAHLPSIQTDPLDQQDPWESQRAWHDTTTALNRGDMQGASDAKSKIEQGQRAMRAEEEQKGEKWQTIFFSNVQEDPVYTKLATGIDTGDDLAREFGFWKYNFKGRDLPSKPYRGDLIPENTRRGSEEKEPPKQTQPDTTGNAAGFAVPRKPVPASADDQDRTGKGVFTQARDAAISQIEPAKPREKHPNPYTQRPLDPRVG
jgi:hypothetical protein